MIQFQHVTKIFKPEFLSQAFTALDDVSFQVPEGSMVGFLGANGAGKTTSLKIIMDFIRPSSGSVIFSPALGKDRREAFRNIGFLPERPYFYQNLTGHEFLRFMGELSELPATRIKGEVEHWAKHFKIDHALGRELKTYSKGMLQRIGFLATILHGPKIIILDEPLSGLDPIGRKELKDVIIEVHKGGKTVFFSSHIVPDIEEICDRVIFLKEGKLVYDGAVASLMKAGGSSSFTILVQGAAPGWTRQPFSEELRLPDGLTRYKVDEGVKDAFLAECAAKEVSVVGLELVRPSLEEIFYHTKGLRG